jgi:hypothetical protein
VIKLKRDDLVRADTASLIRLALFLKLEISPKKGETDGAFRHRLVSAIQRWEKFEARRPKKERT